jgi:hypothetical protein
VKNRAKLLRASSLRFFVAACAITLLTGFSTDSEAQIRIAQNCTSPGIPLNCVEEKKPADGVDGSKTKDSDTDGAASEGSKSGLLDGAVEKLVLLIIFLLTAFGIYLFLKGLMQKRDQNSYPRSNTHNLPPTATYRKSPSAQAPVQNRPKARPVNPQNAGTAYPTQVTRVERESIELVSPVEAKTDSTITAEPEPTSARVRPNLAPIGIPEAEEAPNVLDEVSDRNIIKPPQIGDPSAFRKKNWWDPTVEWCQLSPLGMTSDITCDIGTFGSSAVAAASLRGNKHKLDAKPCQDAFNVQSAKDKSGTKYVVSVLCDGMSSARYSHYGARRTSQVLSDALCRIIENSDIVDIDFVNANIESVLESCRRKVIPAEIDLFGASGIDPTDAVDSDFNTTVTFLIAPSTEGGKNTKAIVGCIGDSPVFVLHNPEGVWEQIGVIDSADELVNPATAAFPGSIAIAIDELDLRQGDALVAMSDGVGNFINVRGNQTLLGNYLAKQWSTPVNMATFVNDVSFDMKSADDDRTVVAIWQRT